MSAISLGASGQAFRILDEAPLDEAVAFPRERLVELFRQMATEDIATLRLLEGGEYNVNIRHIENVTPDSYRTLVHPDTIDVWVVQEGSGTVVTGGEQGEGGRHTGGEERFISVGDLVFIPAGLPHGMKETSSITFLNIRFPEHRTAVDPVPEMIEDRTTKMREIGPEYFIVTSDRGQGRGPEGDEGPMMNHLEGLALAAEVLREHGFTERELDIMFKENPAKLLGLSDHD